MIINYRRLFNLRFRHDYYENENPGGLQVLPTSETVRLLQGGNMLFKELPNGITVLYRTGEDEKTPIVPLGELQLQFTITIRDVSRFQTITQLYESTNKKHNFSGLLLLKNNLADHTDDPENPELLNHALINYEEAVFVNSELSGRKLLGILELTCGTDKGELYKQIQEYSLSLRRKESYWKYFIVDKNRSITDRKNLMVVDKGENDSSPYTSVNFTQPKEVPNGLIQINGYDTIIFKSEDPIPFFEVPKASIQLKQADGSVLIKHLPNPTPSEITKKVGDHLESEIYVYI